MPKTLSFQLTEEGLRENVEAIEHDKRPEVRQRAMGLRLLHEGKPPKEVAEFCAFPGRPFTTGIILKIQLPIPAGSAWVFAKHPYEPDPKETAGGLDQERGACDTLSDTQLFKINYEPFISFINPP